MTDVFSRLVPPVSGDFMGEYDCGSGAVMRLYGSAHKEAFDSCCAFAVDSGLTLLQCCATDLFYAASYRDGDGGVLYLGFSAADGTLRVIFDPYTAVLNTACGAAGASRVRLWQFEVDHSLIDCGMCYIIRCSDFSFFVIDSAHLYSVNDDARIYAFLRKNTPSDMPVRVRGWFFSHGHVDHISKFTDILRYNKNISIDGLYYNFVPLNHFSSGSWFESDKKHTEEFLSEVKKHDIPVYKLHSGQYFYIDSLRFDVLCTHEDVFPDSLENYNDSSTVLMLSVGEDKVCFPGDAGASESKILESRYPDFLSCDIVQVSHHGHFGTSPDFYRAADADVALYPTTRIKFDEDFPRYEANRLACSLASYTFVASDGTVGFTFPLKNSEIELYPDETTENFEGIYNLWGYDYTREFKNGIRDNFKKNSVAKKYTYKKKNG